ncbi:MAG: FG-GAP repeat protein, partial [Deltaproteobacteria bacterium]|nr:FG-GAP repeat protein [Deltaproteobacteria bacterium]
STAGDVNGDGFDDVIVGAPWFYNGEFSQGRTFVYHGSEVGLDAAPAWTAEADPVGQQFGYSVSTAGDLDGDDFDEVVVGTLRTSAVFHGSAAGLDAAAAWTAESDQADALFGGSVSTAGDVNGDGVDDVIVGARYYDNGQSNEGRAFLYEGYRCGVDGEPCPGGLCRASLCDSGVCFVDGSSYDAGDEDPGNECQACVPASDRLGWTADADGTPCAGGACEAGSCAGRCFIGGVFWDAGVADPENECQSCVPAASTSSWTYDTDGTACAGGLCRAGLCDGGSCLVGGVWRAHNTEDPANECQACDVGSDRLDWTDDADGTVCVGGICRAGLCDGGSCLVDGAWHADSAEDPDNECQACDVVRTPLAWTADPDATVCDEGLCRAVQCEAVCRIGGVWSAAGDEREGNECEACAPTVDPFAWTPDADGTLCDGGLCRAGGCSGTSCFIDGIWHEEGEELIGNECQSCAPEVEPFDWTPDTDGTACADGLCRDGVCDGQSCLVMDEWRAAGEEDPVSECRACAPDQDRLAWTEDPEGTECDDGLGWTAEDVCSGGFCAGIECERPVGVDGLPFRAESGSTVGRHPDTPSYGAGCRGVDGAGPDVAYAFEARDGICYRVEVDPEAAFDAELAVTRACAVSVECVAASDDGTTGQAESAVFEAEGDGTVFVLVDGASVLDEGGFSIAIEQADCPNDGDDGGGGGDAGGDGGSRTDAGADGGNGEAGGCACRASGNSASGWLLLALAAIPLRRRHGAG